MNCKKSDRGTAGIGAMGRVAVLVLLAAFAGTATGRAQAPNVTGWGYNANGQTTIPAGLSDAKAIAAGYYHSLALKSDGTLAAWGDNSYGQLGDGATISSTVPVKVAHQP